ncbi:hypothetical protein TWF217_002459 [Orbilia oligospora]|nr:hypothetical protein TWF217_002459 [Orbilia oligospora]
MHAGMLRNCDALSNSFCSFRFAKLGYIAEPIQFPLPTNCTHHAHRSRSSPQLRQHLADVLSTSHDAADDRMRRVHHLLNLGYQMWLDNLDARPNYRTHCFGSFPNEPSQQHRKWSHVGLDQRQGIFGIFTAVADSKYTGNEVPYWDETSHRMDRNSIDLDEPPKMTRPSEPPREMRVSLPEEFRV